MQPFLTQWYMRVKWVCTSNGLTYTLCSFEVRGTDIPCVGKPHQTFPNQFFHQIIDVDSSRAQKRKWETLQKYVEISFQQQTYLLTSWCIWDFAHRLGWNVVGLNNSDYFYNYPLVSWALPAVSNPCFLVLSTLCTKNFKDKAELRNLSIFKPKKPDLLFESRLYNPQNILSTFDNHHSNISWYFESPLR